MVTMTSAKIALARLTNDSIASDNKPTESVMYQASVLSVIVTMAAATEAHSSRCGVRKRLGTCGMRALSTMRCAAHFRAPVNVQE